MFKKTLLTLAVIPVIFSCTVPGTSNDINSSLATKADAVKYFECALNNGSLSEDQKNTIRTSVIAQINAIPDIAWVQAKAGFESAAKMYACNTVSNPSASPTLNGSGSPVPAASATAVSASGTGSISTLKDYRTLLQCAYDNLKAKNSTDTATVLLGISLLSDLNASRYLDDATFVSLKTSLEANATKYRPYCTGSTSASPSPAAGSGLIKVSAGISEYSCDAEKSLKSGTGASINISFINNIGSTVKIYWLDASGNRKVYNGSLAAGAKHSQQTFITHPWVVTDQNDKCLKVFLPSDASANNAQINI